MLELVNSEAPNTLRMRFSRSTRSLPGVTIYLAKALLLGTPSLPAIPVMSSRLSNEAGMPPPLIRRTPEQGAPHAPHVSSSPRYSGDLPPPSLTIHLPPRWRFCNCVPHFSEYSQESVVATPSVFRLHCTEPIGVGS